MQQQLYLTDTYLVEHKTTVARSGRSEEGVAWLALAQNIFHPQGGGQPNDAGTVDGVAATPRRDAADREWILVDLADAEQAPAEGSPVTARVDLETRRLHAALHTAGHLVDAFVRPLGFQHAGNSHFPGQARVDYQLDGAQPDRDELTAQINAQLAEAVAAALKVTSAVTDGVRRVSIEGLNTEPCGGTHVPDLGALQGVVLRSIKIKGGVMKVGYTAEHRADR